MSTFSTLMRYISFFPCCSTMSTLSMLEGGGGGKVQINPTKKALTTFFFSLVLILFYRSKMVIFKENYHLLRFRRGSNFFQVWGGGGPTFSREGSNCLFPIEPHITCDFQGGPETPTPPPPPSGSAFDFFHFSHAAVVCLLFYAAPPPPPPPPPDDNS